MNTRKALIIALLVIMTLVLTSVGYFLVTKRIIFPQADVAESPTPGETPTPEETPTPTPEPTSEPTPTPTETVNPTPTPTEAPTQTPTPYSRSTSPRPKTSSEPTPITASSDPQNQNENQNENVIIIEEEETATPGPQKTSEISSPSSTAAPLSTPTPSLTSVSKLDLPIVDDIFPKVKGRIKIANLTVTTPSQIFLFYFGLPILITVGSIIWWYRRRKLKEGAHEQKSIN